MIRLIGAGCMLALLSGCGAASIEELQNHPAATYEFDAPMSYQATYGLIAAPAIGCFQSASWAASWYTDAELTADPSRGTFALSQTNFGKRYFAVIKIVPKDATTAHVTVWTENPELQHLGPDAQKWAQGKGMGDTAKRGTTSGDGSCL